MSKNDKKRRGTCRNCGVKKYVKFLDSIGTPKKGGWGHGGYWVCKNKIKCAQAKKVKTHMENRGR